MFIRFYYQMYLSFITLSGDKFKTCTFGTELRLTHSYYNLYDINVTMINKSM